MFPQIQQAFQWKVKGRLLPLQKPLVMGILNLTTDSFYDGGKHANTGAAARAALEMMAQGAAIIDIGAMSSRPGAAISDPQKEKATVTDAVKAILDLAPEAVLSIDTIHSAVAEAALREGAAIINDITAGTYSPEMLPVIAAAEAPVILMHMKGLPETMQQHATYTDLLAEITDFFSERIAACTAAGIADVVLDPGFGFAKTTEQNYELLRRLPDLQLLERPLLAGLSRKSMIWKPLNCSPQEALNGTTALNMLALNNGAPILRVHDVSEAVQVVKLWEMYGA